MQTRHLLFIAFVATLGGCAEMTPLTSEQVACLKLAKASGLSLKDLDSGSGANLDQGRSNMIYGKGNHIQGHNNCVVGFDNHVQGNNNSLAGGFPRP
jgi:hypothetical protein